MESELEQKRRICQLCLEKGQELIQRGLDFWKTKMPDTYRQMEPSGMEFVAGARYLQRGRRCPSIVRDLYLANASRGRILHRVTEKTKYSHKYIFGPEGDLRIIETGKAECGIKTWEYLVYEIPDEVMGFTFDEGGKLTGALVNVPCPSQCTEHEEFTSADYWNEAREAIRKEFGNIYILPQCAAAGDLSPHLLHQKEARERQVRLRFGDDPKAEKFKFPIEYYSRRELGEKIAHAVKDGFGWASKEKYTEMPICHVAETLELDRWQVTQQQYDEAKENLQILSQGSFQHTEDPYADFKVNTRRSSELSRCEGVMARFEDKREKEPCRIHVVKVGDIAFTSCPHELYIDYQHRIQARSPFAQTFMVQLAASEVGAHGYLATERAAANKGYSAISYSCHVSPKGGQEMVERTLEILDKMQSEA